jgi:hypothetical protein
MFLLNVGSTTATQFNIPKDDILHIDVPLGSIRFWEFLKWLSMCWFSGRVQFHGVSR